MSPLPDVDEVNGPAERHDQDGVDADVVAGTHVAGSEAFGGDGYPAHPPRVDRHGSRIRRRSRLHFDEGNDLPAAGNDIDFAAAHAGPALEDVPAMKAKKPAGDRLGGAAAPLGRSTARARLQWASSRARA